MKDLVKMIPTVLWESQRNFYIIRYPPASLHNRFFNLWEGKCFGIIEIR